MGLRQSLRIAATAAITSPADCCSLPMPMVPANDRIWRRAPWPYGDMVVKQAIAPTLKEKGKVVVREFKGLCPAQYGVS